MNLFRPKSFIVQLHVTERCNWRCKHCYQESYTTPEMTLKKMEDILNQYINLLKKWGIPKNNARLQITGGEPFVREDFIKFLWRVHRLSKYFPFVIMSNGSLLTKNIVRFLKLIGIQRFQVSIEGLEKTNDEIRGKGAFKKTLEAIKLLVWKNIFTRVSLTLTKKNQSEIRELADVLAPLGAAALAARRIVPIGVGGQFKDYVLEPNELKNFYKEVEEINKEMIGKGCKFRVKGGCENAIFNDEISDRNLMSYNYCGVADGRAVTILPNGDVLACRRLPIKIGNLYEKSLEEIYYSPLYESWRNQEDITQECRSCSNYKNCLGGAKCVTYALTGKTAPDVQCWKLFNSLDESMSKIKNSI